MQNEGPPPSSNIAVLPKEPYQPNNTDIWCGGVG